MEILPIKKAVELGKVPFSIKTLYGFYQAEKHRSWLFKIDGKLVVDCESFNTFVVDTKKKQGG